MGLNPDPLALQATTSALRALDPGSAGEFLVIDLWVAGSDPRKELIKADDTSQDLQAIVDGKDSLNSKSSSGMHSLAYRSHRETFWKCFLDVNNNSISLKISYLEAIL